MSNHEPSDRARRPSTAVLTPPDQTPDRAPDQETARVATERAGAVPDRGPGRLRAAARLLGAEAALTFRRPRHLAMLGVLAVVPILIGVAVRLVAGDGVTESIVAQVAGNGLVLTFAAFFVMLPLILPLAVSVVAGDAVAGEASQGTLRYLLTAPAGRGRLLALKYANVLLFCLAACTLVAVSALVAGLVLFPSGPVTLLSGTTVPFAEGLLRAGVAVLYASAGMAALGALALLFSTLTENPIGAISATVVLVVVSEVLVAIPQLSALRPFLLTSWWNAFDGVLRAPMDTGRMGTGLLVFAGYIVISGSLAWARFTSRDVTS